LTHGIRLVIFDGAKGKFPFCSQLPILGEGFAHDGAMDVLQSS